LVPLPILTARDGIGDRVLGLGAGGGGGLRLTLG
jgi:hypothetical protein